MLQGRDHGAGPGDRRRVDLGDRQAAVLAAVGQHLAPGIDDQGMAEGGPLAGMHAAFAFLLLPESGRRELEEVGRASADARTS